LGVGDITLSLKVGLKVRFSAQVHNKKHIGGKKMDKNIKQLIMLNLARLSDYPKSWRYDEVVKDIQQILNKEVQE